MRFVAQRSVLKPTVADYETLVGDVHDLRAFALAADLRSFTAAAKMMGESKATVSRRIARLESELGVSLLRRAPVEPTDDGTAYRVRVGEILELLGDANAAVRQAYAAPSGQLRLTAPPGFESLTAALVARFTEAYPEVIVSVLVTERFVDLEAEHIDVALRATTKLADSALVAHRLFDFERVAMASPAYLRAHGTPRRLDDLSSHRIVQLGQARTVTMHRKDGTGEATEVRMAWSTSANDMGFARELTIQGTGLAFLPRVVTERDLAEGRLVHVLKPWVMPGTALFLLHRGGRFLPPKVRAFRDFAMSRCPGKLAR